MYSLPDLFSTSKYEIPIDETDPMATVRIAAFLDEYKALCRKYGCLVVRDGADVEICPVREFAVEEDPWGVEEMTRDRGWKLTELSAGEVVE